MVAPGFIRTRMTAGMRGDPAREERLLRAIPMRRWGEPEDVAGAVVFLASPAAAYITGQSLAMDGGLMLR
jgi:3-oxoacyl-[acyl-carrier protein] reductase